MKRTQKSLPNLYIAFRKQFLPLLPLALIAPQVGHADGKLSYALGYANKSDQSSTASSLSASFNTSYQSESIEVVYGRVSASGSASAPITSPSGVQALYGESGESYDNYTFTIPGGGSGVARFTFHLSGDLSGSHTGQGSYNELYEAKVDMSLTTALFTGSMDSTGFSNGSQPSRHPSFTIDRPFDSGTPFYVVLDLLHRGQAESTNGEATPPGDAQSGAAISLRACLRSHEC